MDYMKNAERHIIDGREIFFVRCDKFGNEIPAEKLREMNFSNSIIDRTVTDVADRISAEPSVVEGVYTGGFMRE